MGKEVGKDYVNPKIVKEVETVKLSILKGKTRMTSFDFEQGPNDWYTESKIIERSRMEKKRVKKKTSDNRRVKILEKRIIPVIKEQSVRRRE